MRQLVGLCLTVLACSVNGEIEPTEWDEFVKVATDANWKDVVEKEPLIMVEFYAPWCGACKQMQPYYDKAAKILSEQEKPIPMAKLDAIDNPSQAGLAGLSGYPTLKIFRHGVMSSYTGTLSRIDGLEDKLVDYMNDQVGLSSVVITDSKILKQTFNKKTLDHVAIVGYFPREKDIDFRYFLQVADSFRGRFSFYHVNDASVLESAGYYSGKGAIQIYRPWSGKNFRVMFKGQIFKKSLTDWVLEHGLPPVGVADYDRLKLYQDRKLPILKAIVHSDSVEKKENDLIDLLMPIHKKFGKKVLFVISGETKDYGHSEDDLEKGIFIIEDGKKKFQFDSEEDGKLINWVEKFTKKKLTVHAKSEKIPKKAKAGNVQVVVGKNFNDIVMDDSKDVLLEIYAPWCGHCKKLEPIYKDLAKAFKHSKDIVIAKLDQTSNEVPNKDFKAGGFPTILFASAKNKKPIKYEGARELDDMVAWIKEQSTVTIVEEEEL